eukprot:890957-Pleurochrysis_carterae.AAC.2
MKALVVRWAMRRALCPSTEKNEETTNQQFQPCPSPCAVYHAASCMNWRSSHDQARVSSSCIVLALQVIFEVSNYDAAVFVAAILRSGNPSQPLLHPAASRAAP